MMCRETYLLSWTWYHCLEELRHMDLLAVTYKVSLSLTAFPREARKFHLLNILESIRMESEKDGQTLSNTL
jgi:hypothetical protein